MQCARCANLLPAGVLSCQICGWPVDTSDPIVVSHLSVSTQPKRRGRSVGCIVLYVSLAVLVAVVVLGSVLYEIGSHATTANQAKQAMAMQLYQQVMRKHPTINDAFTGSTSSWST